MKAIDLNSKFSVESGEVYLNGMQALLRIMIDQKRADISSGISTAGLVTGYPGSPVGGVDQEMIRNRALLDQNDIRHQPGLNEELAATAAFGAQLAPSLPGSEYQGVFSLWYGKAPGVERAGDAFHHYNFRGTSRYGGVLAVAGDDPSARSTVFPTDSNSGFYKWYMPILAPGNLQDVIDFGLHGFALSRASGLWVGFKLVTDVADSGMSVQVGLGRVVPAIPDVAYGGSRLVPKLRINDAGPVLLEGERELYYGKLEIARQYARLNNLNKIMLRPANPRIGLVAAGATYYALRQALRDLGLDEDSLLRKGVAILKIGMLFPLEPNIIREFSLGLEELIVIEDKRPFLEGFIKDILYSEPRRPKIVGKQDQAGDILFTAHGELSSGLIARALGARLGRILDIPSLAQKLDRLDRIESSVAVGLGTSHVPYFCSGCPHNRSLQAPDDAIIGAGTGCHIMAIWMDERYGKVEGYTQMGGEGAQWVGANPYCGNRHVFQNMGDGTFAHSGSLAIRFAVASGTNVTFKILYNSTVAMTGGQDILGGMSVARMVSMLEAEGVARIIITTEQLDRYPGGKVGGAEVWGRDRLIEAQRVLSGVSGASVLIHDQQCATEKRRDRKRGKSPAPLRKLFINERVCEGCGDCATQSNCLSLRPVVTEYGDKTRIHQSSCNQDESCLDGDCPSFLSVDLPDALPRSSAAIAVPEKSLPDPQMPEFSEVYAICMAGVGGTGVVTANQILGVAAFLGGARAHTFDDMGSSQKAGPVTSYLKIAQGKCEFAGSVGVGEADLMLGFDALALAQPTNLRCGDPDRTKAVVSTAVVPNGEMVVNRERAYPEERKLRAEIDKVSLSGKNIYFDALEVSTRLFGDHLGANMLLIGAAYQSGFLPIPAKAIEEAIRLNGTAVPMNLAAFQWGRAFIHDPASMAHTAAPEVAVDAMPMRSELAEQTRSIPVDDNTRLIIAARASELVDYQNIAYAKSYLALVNKAAMAEQAINEQSHKFCLAVANNLFKLMAYKDEYEVARLLLDKKQVKRVKNEFGNGARIRYNLRPTFLRSLGFNRKISFGQWFTCILQGLQSAKKLRGTSFDILGMTKVRRLEREILSEYRAAIDGLCDQLSLRTYDAALLLAELPGIVRGYEDVKVSNIKRYQDELNAALLKVAGCKAASETDNYSSIKENI